MRPTPPRVRALVLGASVLAGVLACADRSAGPPRYSTALLLGTWQSTVPCPHEGYIYDYAFTAVASGGGARVLGREYPRACGNYSVSFPEVSASYIARGDSVRIESGPQCCTYGTGVEREFVTRVVGQFVDSNTIRVTRRNYVDAAPISVPESFTLVRQ